MEKGWTNFAVGLQVVVILQMNLHEVIGFE